MTMADGDDKRQKPIAITLRLDPEVNRRFGALLSLNGETANDVLRIAVDKYIKEHEHMLNI